MDEYIVSSKCTAANIGRVVNDTIESATKGDMVGCPGEMIGWTNTTKQSLTVTFDTDEPIGKLRSRTIGPNQTLMVVFTGSSTVKHYEYSADLAGTMLGRPPEADPSDPGAPPRPRIRVGTGGGIIPGH